MISIKNWDGKGKFDACSLYNWRLDWLETQIKTHRKNDIPIQEEQYEMWFKQEQDVYENNLKNKTVIDKFDKDTAIIVPTHCYQNVWLKSCLEACSKTGLFTLVAYDNPFFDRRHVVQQRMPSTESFMLCDLFLMKQKTWGGGVGTPHSWNMWYGLNMLKSIGFEYIFNINGDCIMEHPENFPEIRKALGDADIISCEWIPRAKHLGTMSFLGKTDCIHKVWTKNLEHLFCFNIGNAEARFGRWALDEGYKIVDVENPDEAHFKPPGSENATWRKILGFRHLHAEHKVRRKLRMEPVEEKYFDKQFLSGHEQNSLAMYWKTGDKQHLESWWG
jgi:hypothetical protein